VATRKMAAKKPGGSGIKINPANKGKLHAALGVPQGQKIPAAKLAAAKKSKNPAVRKEANFAVNARKFKHK
jgi:hypothetical protein